MKVALREFERALGAPRRAVPNFGVPQLSLLAHNIGEVQLLGRRDYAGCGENGSLSIYSVSGDPDATWRRMRRSGAELESGHTQGSGRRVRLLTQSGYDYLTEAALIEGSDGGPLLVVRVCG